jgi:hypothetical protein
MTITLTREEAQQVLDALEYNQANWQGKDKAIETLRARLAQPEPKPVVWMYDWTTSDGEFIEDWTTSEAETLRDTEPNIISNIRPLYTAPPKREWQGLTYEEIKEILDCGRSNLINIKKAEQKLKEKNYDKS